MDTSSFSWHVVRWLARGQRRAGLVDEVNIQFLPAIIGGFDTPSLFAAPNLKADEAPTRLDLISAQVEAGGRVWLRYRVVREAAPFGGKP